MNTGLLALATIDDLGSWLWRANWQAAVLAGLIALVLLCVGRRLAPTWRYALWILVVVRLCLPIVPASPLSVFNLWPGPDQERPALVPTEVAAGASPVRLSTEVGAVPDRFSPRPGLQGPETALNPASAPRWDWREIVMFIWLIGAAGLAAAVLISHLRFAARVRAQSRRVADAEVLKLIERSCRETGVGRRVEVRSSEGLGTPALFGAWRPVVLLPREMLDLDRDLLRFVLLHELAHVKRRDVHINWLLTAVAVVHWFNPLVHYVVSRCRQERELICDQMVLDIVGPAQRRAYGRAVIDLFEQLVGEPAPALAVGFFGRRSLISRRIQMISTTSPNRRRGSFMAMALLAALAGATLTDARVTPPVERATPGTAVNSTGGSSAEALVSPPASATQDPRGAAEVRDAVYDIRDLLDAAVRTRQRAPLSPLVSSLLAAESRYIVSAGDSLPLIASSLLGDARAAGLIAERNGLSNESASLRVGQILVVPRVAAEESPASAGEVARSAAVSDLLSVIGQRLRSENNKAVTVQSMDLDPRTGLLQVRGGAQDHERVAALLSELRASDHQILIETRFLTGLEEVVARGDAAVQLPPEQDAGRARVFTLTAREIEFITKATEDEKRVALVASPRLLVVNGQEASLSMTSSSEVAVPNAEPGGKRVALTVTEGISMTLQAEVSDDRRHITLHLQPTTLSLDLTGALPIERRVNVSITVNVADGGAALLQLSDVRLTLIDARLEADPETGEMRPVVTRGAAEVPAKPLSILICPKLILELGAEADADEAEPRR